MSPFIHVLLVDPTPTTQTAIRALVAATTDLRLLDESTTSSQSRGIYDELPYDLMLMEIGAVPPWSIIATMRRYLPYLQILIIGDSTITYDLKHLRESGVAGCILKHEISPNLAHLIRAIAYGGSCFTGAALWPIQEPVAERGHSNPTTILTERELQVLKRIASGLSNAKIAADLHLAKQTVSNNLVEIYEKLGIRTRAEAIAWFNSHGLK